VEEETERARSVANTSNKSQPRDQPGDKSGAKKSAAKGRSYVVQQGDTLASISRKFYKSADHWRKIQHANSDTLANPAALKPGQTLVIP
jgi:nucleoid-associated protein YgaU